MKGNFLSVKAGRCVDIRLDYMSQFRFLPELISLQLRLIPVFTALCP